MNILLTGATGYVGGAVLAALQQAGHEVTAVVRSDESAAKARDAGATPVVGDLADTDWLAGQLAEADGAIHAASPGDATSADFDRSVATAAVRAFTGTTKPYVHTSGAWIWGNGTDLTELSPLDPPALTAWRPGVEDIVLGSDLHGAVVAPAIVYGHGGGIPNLVVNAPRDGSGAAVLIGDGTQHWGTVHVDDLAQLYVLALTSGRSLGRVAAVSGDHPTVRDLFEATGAEVVPDTVEATRARLGETFADALLVDQQFASTKAAELGWVVASASLVEDLRSGSYAQHG